MAAGTIAAVAENPDTARDITAACTAGYLTATGGVYAESVSAQGYATQVDAIIAANPRPSPRRASVPPAAQPSHPPPNRYSTNSCIGWWDRAADIVTILLPPGLPWPTIEATLLAGVPC